jgi:hypothetical protein
LSNVVQLEASGIVFSLALSSNGKLTAWGSSHTNIPAGLSNVVMISVANTRSIAVVGKQPPVQDAFSVNPTSLSGGFSFELPSQSQRAYVPEYVESLTQTNWSRLPMVAGTGTNLLIFDSNATNSQRFYRVRRW